MASSSSRSGVHIQVTSGAPFTSSQTGTSSTAAWSAIRPPRFSGRIGGEEDPEASELTASTSRLLSSLISHPSPLAPRTIGVESGVLGHAHAVEGDTVGEAGGELPEEMAGGGPAGRERLPVGELRHPEVHVLLVVGRHHLLGHAHAVEGDTVGEAGGELPEEM